MNLSIIIINQTQNAPKVFSFHLKPLCKCGNTCFWCAKWKEAVEELRFTSYDSQKKLFVQHSVVDDRVRFWKRCHSLLHLEVFFSSLFRLFDCFSRRVEMSQQIYNKSFIRRCNPAGAAYLDEAPLLPLSFCFAPSDFRVLIRKLWTGLFPPSRLLSSHPTRVSLHSALHRSWRHQWDQYQDWPALPVRIQCSRKFANSPSLPLTSLAGRSTRAPVRWRKIKECLGFFFLLILTGQQTVFIISVTCLRDGPLLD